jgi:hypothetical protein
LLQFRSCGTSRGAYEIEDDEDCSRETLFCRLFCAVAIETGDDIHILRGKTLQLQCAQRCGHFSTMLTLSAEIASIYRAESHSRRLVSVYGMDWALISIASSMSVAVFLGDFKFVWRLHACISEALPYLSKSRHERSGSYALVRALFSTAIAMTADASGAEALAPTSTLSLRDDTFVDAAYSRLLRSVSRKMIQLETLRSYGGTYRNITQGFSDKEIEEDLSVERTALAIIDGRRSKASSDTAAAIAAAAAASAATAASKAAADGTGSGVVHWGAASADAGAISAAASAGFDRNAGFSAGAGTAIAGFGTVPGIGDGVSSAGGDTHVSSQSQSQSQSRSHKFSPTHPCPEIATDKSPEILSAQICLYKIEVLEAERLENAAAVAASAALMYAVAIGSSGGFSFDAYDRSSTVSGGGAGSGFNPASDLVPRKASDQAMAYLLDDTTIGTGSASVASSESGSADAATLRGRLSLKMPTTANSSANSSPRSSPIDANTNTFINPTRNSFRNRTHSQAPPTALSATTTSGSSNTLLQRTTHTMHPLKSHNSITHSDAFLRRAQLDYCTAGLAHIDKLLGQSVMCEVRSETNS